ncbi:MAG: hypothetical protein KDH15_18900 [Rhodocyclaceae bacterium]|nr:hypothetical protein [Rhodocyclaceae bacterium]
MVACKKDWFVLNVGDAMLAGDELDRVKTRFEWADGSARASAVLMRHESEGRLHCELKLYFPPEIERLALDVGATRCAAPAPAGLDVLAGDPGRLKRLRSDADDSAADSA